MNALRAASLRHLWRHPAQLALALVGLALGVGTIVAVEIATASARRAFELSLEAVNGAATHQIVGGPAGIDERLYVQLRRAGDDAADRQLAPVVAGYVSVRGRIMELVGVDPFASAQLEEGTARPTASAVQGPQRARAWLTQPGALVMSAAAARQLGLAEGGRLQLEVGGVPHQATLIASLADAGAGFDTVILTDIAQAQEWLESPGRLSRIDVRLPAGAAGEAAARALAARLPAEAAKIAAREQALIALCRSPQFSLEKLRAAITDAPF